MSGGPILRKTKLFGFNIIRFDFARWHEFEHQNWDALDANLAQLGLISNAGVWQNNTSYLVGDRVVDTNVNAIYTALVAHSSPSTGTFAEYRTANPTHWRVVSAVPNYRGTYADGVAYYSGDIARSSDGFVYKLALQQYTSVAGSFNNGAYWTTVFDATAATSAAAASASAAATSASQALGYRNSAQTSEQNASMYASQASTSEANADADRIAAQTAKTQAETARTQAQTAQSAAETAATNASGSASVANSAATNAAAYLNDFNNRYMTPKAADPSVDDQGDPLTNGILYWNTTNNVMRVWNAGVWRDATANVTISEWQKTTTVTTTVLSGLDDSGRALTFTANLEMVFINGNLIPDDDYVLTTNVITLNTPVPAGTFIEVKGFSPFTVSDVYLKGESDAKYQSITNPRADCYLYIHSTTEVRLIPRKGNQLWIDGQNRTLPLYVSVTGAPTNGTQYYFYAYMNAGVIALERSTTVPIYDALSGMKVKTGDPSRTYVGTAVGSSGNVYQQDATIWYFRSEYNELLPSIGGYSGSAADIISTSWTVIRTVYLLSLPEDNTTIVANASAYTLTAANQSQMGLAVDGTTFASTLGYHSVASAYVPHAPVYSGRIGAGPHAIDVRCAVTNNANYVRFPSHTIFVTATR